MKPLKALTRWLGAMAMLSLYVLGSTQTGYLHQLVHGEELMARHSPQVEEDPCHRAQHHGVDTGCHKVHLEKVHSCGLCHTLADSDLVLFDQTLSAPIRAVRELGAWVSARCTVEVIFTLHTRGPPMELHA